MSVSQTLSRSLAVGAMTLFVAQLSQAQTVTADQVSKPSSKSSAKEESADGISTVSDTEPASIRPFPSGTSTLNSNAVTPETTSTANLAKEIEKAAPRRWFGEFYSETYTAKSDFQNHQGTPSLDSYAGVKYDFGNARGLSLRQNFQYIGAQGGGVGNFKVQDLAINYIDGKLATFAKDGAIILIARAYLPTGENSRFITKNAGVERLYLLGTKSFGKLDLTYVWLGQQTNWTQDSYQTIGADGSIAQKQNAWLTGLQEFDAFYNVTSKFAVGALIGNEFDRKRPLAGENDLASDFYIQPTLQFSPNKGLTFQAALYDDINIYNPTRDFALGRDEDISVYFNVAASL